MKKLKKIDGRKLKLNLETLAQVTGGYVVLPPASQIICQTMQTCASACNPLCVTIEPGTTGCPSHTCGNG